MPELDASVSPVSLRNALLSGLVSPPGSPAPDGFLLQCDDALALAAVGGDGSPVVVLTYDPQGDPTQAGREPARDAGELGRRVQRVVEQQPARACYIVVAGGGAEAREVLEEAAREAHELRTLGLYHLSSGGKLERVAGRRLGVLESAGRGLAQAKPFGPGDIEAALRAAREGHLEEARFAASVRGRFPLVSAVIAAGCVGMFALATKWAVHTQWDLVLFAMGSNAAQAVREGQVWRLLASAFLHGNSTHLMVNLMSLYFVGVFLEQVLGRRRYLLVYGLSALGGALASALLRPSGASVGASGAIWGLMMAGFGLALRPRGVLPAVIAGRLRRSMVLPLVINVGVSLLPGIDMFAHFGGGAVGLALALTGALGGRRPIDGPAVPGAAGGPVRTVQLPAPSRLVQIAAWTIGLAMLGSVALALAAGRPWDLASMVPADLF